MRISDWSSDVCSSDLIAAPAFAQGTPAAPMAQAPATPGVGDAIDRALGDLGSASNAGQGDAPMALSLQILIIMGLLTVLPGIVLMMTSFTRIIIVLSILRHEIGRPSFRERVCQYVLISVVVVYLKK